MSKVYFLLCVHNHQPVGNFEWVIEQAYNKAYKPFLETLNEYPNIKFALHCSGILWDYFLDKHKEYVDMVKKMVERGQIELVSGGYYEPILSSIPQKDRIGQIKMMNKFLYNTFGVKPQGLWLTERVWEQSIVKDIVDTGIKYTLVDDYVFYMAGINKKENPEITDYYLTEEEGRILYVFPISQTLRYYIPFKEVKEVINLFSKFTNDLNNSFCSLTMGDDGEKFGIWPKTYEHVYENGWLKNLLEELQKNQEWLKTATISDYIKLKPPKGRIYLPTASYFEMGEWCLPTSTQEMFEYVIKNFDNFQYKEIIQQFFHGGYWKNFFVKYPESNNMHKKMLYISELLGKNSKLKKIFYKSQCNCAYWHGVFGGLYLPHLREAIYENLIKVEKSLAEEDIYVYDFDKDGEDEINVNFQKFSIYIKPSYGGSVYEIDLKDYDKNLLNVLSRKKEVYHNKLIEFENNNSKFNFEEVKTIHDIVLTKEKDLDKRIYYDWHLRYSFLDHFLHLNTKFEDFYKSKYVEQGDFTIESYKVKSIDRENLEISLFRDGNAYLDNNKYAIRIEKKYKINTADSTLTCFYSIKNNSDSNLKLWFLSELNFLVFTSQQDLPKEIETNNYKLYDEVKKFSVEIYTLQNTLFWIYPIETISLSEAGFERVYQGMCIGINFKFSLESREEYNTEISLRLI